MLYNVVQTVFNSVDEILKCDYSNESYWAVPCFGTVYYAVQGDSKFWSVDEVQKCDHSNESHTNVAVVSCGAVYYYMYAVQGSKLKEIPNRNLQVIPKI